MRTEGHFQAGQREAHLQAVDALDRHADRLLHLQALHHRLPGRRGRAHTSAHIHTYIHTHNTHIHVHTQTHTHTTHTYTPTHTQRTHTHIHTHNTHNTHNSHSSTSHGRRHAPAAGWEGLDRACMGHPPPTQHTTHNTQHTRHARTCSAMPDTVYIGATL